MTSSEEWAVATDTVDSFWGSGAHPYHASYPHSYRSRIFSKSDTVRGDHFHSFPYSIKTEHVASNRPVFAGAYGADYNGTWQDERKLHMSQWLSTPLLTPPARFNTDLADLHDEVITKALNKLREEKAGWGANVLQAEQTAEMVASSSLAVLEAYRAARKGNFGAVERALGITGPNKRKRLSNTWLQYIYGWLPLMSDIHDGVKTLQRIIRDEHAYKSVGSKATREFNFTIDSGSSTDQWRGKVKVKCGLKIRASSSFLDAADSLGILNPLEVAWDVVPYSFVLDWFIPVGNTLSALSAGLGLDFVDGYVSTLVDISKTSRMYNVKSLWDSRFEVLDQGELEVVKREFTRVPLYSFPTPGFYLSNKPFSSFRIGAAVALISQRI